MFKKIFCSLLLLFFSTGLAVGQYEGDDYSYRAPKVKQKKETKFILTLLDINLGKSFSDIQDVESNAYSISVTYVDGKTLSGSPAHLNYGASVIGEYLTSPNFGIRFGIAYRGLYQLVSVGDDTHESENWGGTLLSYWNPFVGISWHLGKASKSNFSLNAQIGYITGTQKIGVALADYLGVTFPETAITGFNYGIGLSYNHYFSDDILGLSFYSMFFHNFFSADKTLYNTSSGIDANFSTCSIDFGVSLFLRL